MIIPESGSVKEKEISVLAFLQGKYGTYIYVSASLMAIPVDESIYSKDVRFQLTEMLEKQTD